MKTPRRFTKVPKVRIATRITLDERELVYEAAKARGIAQAEMVREAIREHAARVVLAARRG